MDRLAKNGAHFPNAVAQGPMCGASWNGLLTNLYSHNLGFYRNGHLRYLPEETWTVPPILQKAGYQTASIGKSHIQASADHPRASKAEALRSYGFDYARCTGGRYALWKAIKDGKPVDEVPFIQHLKNREKYDQFVKDNTSFGNLITMENDIDYLDGYTAQVGVE
ncbi:MAG: sulfatase-like hydrolase/transferase [Rubripirellula sp.]|nr:sulfatase-like hydrolase/transferase [Rubripirellula sp.]